MHLLLPLHYFAVALAEVSGTLDRTTVLSGLLECWLATFAPTPCDYKLKASCPAGDNLE